MHDGCGGNFDNGIQVVDKVRQMGFSSQPMPMPLELTCVECDETFEMITFEEKCPNCKVVYGVPPCHAFDSANIKAAGIGY